MNRQQLMRLLWVIFGILLVGLTHFLIPEKPVSSAHLSTYLSRPIANEMTLITSAGQSTDTYIVQDLANQLRLHNLFMPQATEEDLEAVSSVMIVVGFSEMGQRLHDKRFIDEKIRLEKILATIKDQDLPLILVYIGGKARRSRQTDQLLSMTCEAAEYIIATRSGNTDDFISDLARTHQVPIALIEHVTDLTEPLASAFR